jgi:phosphohistidine phosphatase
MDNVYFTSMKRLLVIRHAKSSWDYPELEDFERPLNERGKKDAPRMGKRIKEKDLPVDYLISSPAKRAFSTSKRIADALQFPREKIITNKNLYHADEDGILKIVRSIPDSFSVALLFGHNPGLTEFVNALLNEHIQNIPTCGVVSCLLEVPSWKELKWGKGTLEYFDFPKKKD